MDVVRPEEIDLGVLIQEGVTLLREDMERHPSLDPNRPYREKNAYFIRTQAQANRLFILRLPWVAELYFRRMLDEILEYERASGKHFNKGMVYANLGIAQITTGKFDAGIAHLLTADWEDRDFVHDDHDILNTHLWQQFERPYVFDYLIGLNNNPDAALSFTIDEDFLDGLFGGMDKQDRIFLEGTIWALRENLRQNAVHSNVYTRGRLYSGLKDVCLLMESLLRRKQVQDGTIAAGTRDMLGGLLANTLAGQNIGYPQQDLSSSANDLQEFVNNLENILNNANSTESRRIYCLHLVRNFTGHHFDLSETITSPSGLSFFDMYETVLVNVLSVLLYFEHIDAI
ncbi:MAG: hypothetical protein SXV54_28110 [Chloroflexota bacterium]|nr:hypothetical protein [Chloroflexota bacterium]